MPETERVTLVGNLTADPELRYTPSGLQVANLRLAVTPRTRQQDGSWTQGQTSFHTVTVWRDQAEHAAETLTKGARVIVVGRPKQRSWTDADGTEHQVVEVDAEEAGASPRWATATLTRSNGGRKAASQVNQEPPFQAAPGPGAGRDPCWARRTRPLPNHLRRWHPLFYTTATDDGALTVTCDRCFASLSCSSPRRRPRRWGSAAASSMSCCAPG
jgi:single-strand DNA-binding protein